MEVKQEKFTYKKFQKLYPNDKACLDSIFQARYGHETVCDECKKPFKYYNAFETKYYECAWCARKISPLAGTILHKSSTSLRTWFFAIFLFTHSRNGVSAKELQRLTGVTYKTAWRMCFLIRKLFDENNTILTGTVEMDEAYMGGKEINKHASKRIKDTQGNSTKTKKPIIGALDREGKVIVKVVSNLKSQVVRPFLREHIDMDANLITDTHSNYKKLRETGYKNHEMINKSKKEFARGEVHTNTIEGFWSQLKRSINGTYHCVSPKHLQSYVNEFSFRYNHRKQSYPLFYDALQKVVRLVE